MKKRVFTIGERVWYNADHMTGWGKIGLINREDTYKQYNCDDDDILTVEKDSGGEIECWPENVYQLAHGLTFFGNPVVWDHESEEYPLYCPERDENVFMCETEQNLARITDEPHSYEFYSIEDGVLHVSAYLWHDEDRGWVLTEFTFCLVPKEEILACKDGLGRQFIVDGYEQAVTQYEKDGLTAKDALRICNSYNFGQRLLDYSEITEDTPNGNYVTKVR